jgi:hypothetical protein
VARNANVLKFKSTQLLPAQPLASLWTSETLIAISIVDFDYRYQSVEEKEIVATAIAENRSLEFLELANICETVQATHILGRLSAHATLRQLSLQKFQHALKPEDMSAVSAMLRASNLQRLFLKKYFFDLASWKCIRRALVEASTVTHLSINGCQLEAEAAQDLVRYLKHSPVTHLYICDRRYGAITQTSKAALASLVVNILVSTGSTIERLHVEGNPHSLPTNTAYPFLLFRGLRIKGVDVSIPYLRVDFLPDDDALELADWLSGSLNLRDLTVDSIDQGFPKVRFLHALRQNGSICRLSIPEVHVRHWLPDRLVFTNADKRKIRAYGQRNEQLPKLLTTHDDEIRSSENGELDLPVYPTAFAAARQAPRTACNTLFLGLLAATRMSA